MLSNYYTVKKEDFDQLVIQKSRFIGYVKRVETEEEAQDFVQKIKKKHHDATHNCSAYMVGEHNQVQKANDDGEPNGTAGVPILEVLKKQDLKDTAVVVTRYFGGIKLGAGGLIRAYSSTTSQALQTAGVVERKLMKGFSIVIDYSLLGKLENALRNSDYILDSINYLDTVEFIVYVPDGEEAEFRNWIVDLTSDNAIFSDKGTAYVEIDV
ncbi:YigZ family protein [Lentibacillus sp. CBA3610]|uniref:YigZ family protein n=1 Tax=Lentibacillus sp. CBA3610 TaxID=2518176 RepID=UPI001595741A|nr:YigZ family protein [Lentibacillus sp. CBA3610]QKY69953.1 YigZ family protein [Lentibacillus sp. CBA3610]